MSTDDDWQSGLLRAAAGGHARGSVVKFGGSLLARPGWVDEIRDVVRRSDGPASVIVGGGALVDGLRAIDAASPLPAALTHRLAIDALGLTARLAAEATGLPLVVAHGAAPAAILDVPAWLTVGARWRSLPVGWHVTSDSIAALVAAVSGAALVLVKSVSPPADDVAAAAAAGWLDPHFPLAAEGVATIRWTAPVSPG
jgi:5-(aminomethyl)-3-furanmethanol phosphate kinase